MDDRRCGGTKKAQVRVAFISDGRAQPIPKSLRELFKADVI
jgi:acyl-CoA thioester hydrolase